MFLLLLRIGTSLGATALWGQSEGLPQDTIRARALLKHAIELRNSEPDSAILLAETSANIYQKHFGDSCVHLANAYTLMSICYAGKGMPLRAIQLSVKALDVATRTIGYETRQCSNILLNLGAWYEFIDWEKSLAYTEACLAVRQKVYGALHQEVAIVHSSIADKLVATGDYRRAIEHQFKALAILQQLPDRHAALKANACAGLGNAYAYMGQYDKVNRYYARTLHLRDSMLKPNDLALARTYSNWGTYYLEQDSVDKAVAFQKKALEIRMQNPRSIPLDIATSYNNLGLALDKKGLVDSAIFYLKKTVEIRIANLSSHHPRLGSAYLNLAEAFHHKGDLTAAIEHYQKALPILLANVNSMGGFCAQTLSTLMELLVQTNRQAEIQPLFEQYNLVKKSPFSPNTLQGSVLWLPLEGKYRWRVANGDYNATQQSLAPFERMDSILSSEQYLSWPIDTRTTFLNYIQNGYAAGAGLRLQAADRRDRTSNLEIAFKYAEKSKLFSLYGKLKEDAAKIKAGIPDSLLEWEAKTYRRINFLEQKIRESDAANGALPDSLNLARSSELFDLKAKMQRFKQDLNARYPRYHRLKYDHQTASIAYVQDSLLQNGQGLLEYVIADKEIIVFLIKKDTALYFRVPKNFPLEKWVTAFYESIRTYSAVKEQSDAALDQSIARYIELGDSLYQNLIFPLAQHLPKSLLIIPDGILNYIPFEALLEAKPENRYYFPDFRYFGLSHDISYCYSATLLREMRTKTGKTKPFFPFIGFAPYADPDTTHWRNPKRAEAEDLDSLQSLPHSGAEIQLAQTALGGQKYIGPDASKAQFLRVAGQACVIHLATHAKAVDRGSGYAWIAFRNVKGDPDSSLLYIGEVYGLSLQADLVVLSACKTGFGPLGRGEGMASLAHAFAYAGARSIATSLWDIEDIPTSTVMKGFYKNLKNGRNKQQALAQAKRDFIQHAGAEWAHPCYWAGLIGIGF